MAKKPTEIVLACGVLGEAHEGSIIVQSFTRKGIEWILGVVANLKQHVLTAGPSSFYRIQFFDGGEFYKTTGKYELDKYLGGYDSWAKLTPARVEGLQESQLVRTDVWTMGIGDSDILYTFREKHVERELESRLLTLDYLRKLLGELA